MKTEQEFILEAAIAFCHRNSMTAESAFYMAQLLNDERKRRGYLFEGEKPVDSNG